MARVEPVESRKRISSLDSALLTMLGLGTESFTNVRELLEANNVDEVGRECSAPGRPIGIGSFHCGRS